MTHPFENRRDDGTNPGDQFRGTSSADRSDGRFSEGWGADSAGDRDFLDEFMSPPQDTQGSDGNSYRDYDGDSDASSFEGFDDFGSYGSGDYDSGDFRGDDYDAGYDGDYDDVSAYSGYSGQEEDVPSSAADDGKVDTFGGDRSGTILIAVLGGLAVIASVLMLFTDSTTWMKVAALAALWAGVVGGILTTKYRRQLVAERERVRDIEERHRIELEKEVVTHREQELLLEQNYLDSVDQDRDELLAELRAEVQALREHLVELIGDSFDEERVALRARAERLRELEEAGSSANTSSSSTPLTNPEAYNRPTPRVHADRNQTADPKAANDKDDKDEPVDVPVVDTPQAASGFTTGGFRSVKWGQEQNASREDTSARADSGRSGQEPSTTATPKSEARETTESKPESAPAAPESSSTSVAPARSRWSKAPGSETSGSASAPASGASAKSGQERKTSAKQPTTPSAPPTPTAAQSAAATTVMPSVPDGPGRSGSAGSTRPAGTSGTSGSAGTADAQTDADSSDESAQSSAPRGRRRAEDHSDGLTVAELLAQMRQNKD